SRSRPCSPSSLPPASGALPAPTKRMPRARPTRTDPEESTMLGSMMQQPLLISSLLVHAERHHGEQEVVSRRVEGDVHRYTYRELATRARRMANALKRLGVQFG